MLLMMVLVCEHSLNSHQPLGKLALILTYELGSEI